MQVSVLGEPSISGMRQVTVPANAWEELPACLLCGKADGLREAGRVDGTEPAVTVSLCLHCEYGFLRRRPTESWFTKFYAEDWDADGQAASALPITVTPAPKVHDFCAPFLKPGMRVLDVGGGFGKMLMAFKNKGYAVCATEPSTHRQRFLNDKLDIPCWGSLQEMPATETAGLVCMNHVLEHVLDPVKMIADIRTKLASGGMLYIAVPDFWQEFPIQSFHFVPHVSLFTMQSLVKLLTSHGFRVLKTQTSDELQIIVEKSDGTTSENTKPNGAFLESASTYLLGGFASGILLWHIRRGSNRRRVYASHVFPGWSWLPGAIFWILTHRKLLPSTLYRRLPFGLGGWLPRVVKLQVTGKKTLPIVMHHHIYGAPVWVK